MSLMAFKFSRYLARAFYVVAALAIALFSAEPGCAALGGRATGERLMRIKRSPNYKNGKFVNLYPLSRIRAGKAIRKFITKNRYRTPGKPLPVMRRSGKAFDLTLIESGAYDELWPDFHMGPEQADTGCSAPKWFPCAEFRWNFSSTAASTCV